MATYCPVTGRRPGFGNTVGHSHRRQHRRVTRTFKNAQEMALLPYPRKGR